MRETFVKVYNREDLKWQYERCREFLCALHPYAGFPKLIACDDQTPSLTMTWCGGPVGPEHKALFPLIRAQLRALLKVLKVVGIRHRDITFRNILWHPSKGLHLIDFGWATWEGEGDEVIPVPPLFRAWMIDRTDEEMAVATLWQLEHGGEVRPAEELVRFAGARL